MTPLRPAVCRCCGAPVVVFPERVIRHHWQGCPFIRCHKVPQVSR